jgi:16S rRNA (cytidine1402-2'-O)-methyltransferase
MEAAARIPLVQPEIPTNHNGTVLYPGMPGRLHVVSTPIGNLDDITLRALATLKSVALIAAEDTRRTGILLRHFGITTSATSLHEHNERQKIPHLLARLGAGSDVALVSDAGTPLVSDPGQRLIGAAIADGIQVVPIPGPSAVLSALISSGFPADSFVFAGFAPYRAKDLTKWLSDLLNEPRTVVFFESPHRIAATMRQIASIFGDRPISVARELTKLHEEIIRGRATDDKFGRMTAKGEFTLVLGPVSDRSAVDRSCTDSVVAQFFYQITDLGVASRREAVAKTGKKFGLSTNQVYSILEKFKLSSVP